jgi:hypothetical protein
MLQVVMMALEFEDDWKPVHPIIFESVYWCRMIHYSIQGSF